MNAEEIRRRLTAYLAMPVEERPIPVRRLGEAIGQNWNTGIIYDIAHGKYRPGRILCRRIERVLKLLEEGRLVVVREPDGRHLNHLRIIDEGAPRPAVIRRVMQMTPRGPRLANEVINPWTWPPPPPLFVK